MIAAYRRLAAPLACAVFCSQTAAASTAPRALTFDLTERDTVCVQTPGAPRLGERCDRQFGPSQQDSGLAQAMRGADATTGILHYTDNGRTFLILLVSVPSNRGDRTGYCGAGYEDSLVSVRIDGDRLRLTDRLLIQSCRESLTLEGGRPDNFGRALVVDIELREVRLQRESSGHGTVIRMQSGTFQETTAP